MIRRLILRLLGQGKHVVNLGLDPLKKDSRDEKYSLGLFGILYTPKYDRKMIDLPFGAKIQRFNTCGFVASTGAKEVDEKVRLDQRVFVMFGRLMGVISGDGFSNLRDNEKVAMEHGFAEEGILKHIDNGTWDDYSDPKHLTKEIRENALKHRTKSYSYITGTNAVYKAIDDGRTVKIGVGWRTFMNMRGGFSFPWILDFVKGFLVGGHALYVYGYDLNYRLKGNKCFAGRNSYGDTYGDNGTFWIKEADLKRETDNYGAFINYDLERDVIKWLSQHQGKIVKAHNNNDVYLIKEDKKYKYPDLATLYAHGRLDQDIIGVDPDYLNEIDAGDEINFWDGPNVHPIKAIIQQQNNLKPIFEKYFSELFN